MDRMDNGGIPSESPKVAVKMAHTVCSLLSTHGQLGGQNAASYLQQEVGYSRDQMLAAVEPYCPENGP
jgi:Protein of unknown function (DUF732)